MNCLSDLLNKRRSIRDYQDKPVALDTIKEVIQDCTLAASSWNLQPWKFIIIHDRKLIKKISDECKTNLLARISRDPEDPACRSEKDFHDDSYNVFYNAPALVLILGMDSCRSLSVDCALAASYFMLSATGRDLGTCWVGSGTEIQSQELRSEIGIPNGCSIIAPITVGYPATIPELPERKPPEILNIITE